MGTLRAGAVAETDAGAVAADGEAARVFLRLERNSSSESLSCEGSATCTPLPSVTDNGAQREDCVAATEAPVAIAVPERG